jgi:outer membrane receptor protein involved in Fe transport
MSRFSETRGWSSQVTADALHITPGLRALSIRRSLGFFTMVLGLMAAMIALPLRAQVETGQLAGTVTDPTGAVVPGAAVHVTNAATGATRQLLTTAVGAYLFTGLEPGTYKFEVRSSTFRPFSATAEVTVGGHTTLDAKLSVSGTVTEITVVGAGGTVVNTATQEMSQLVDSQQLEQLPSLTRNAYDFVNISGNVSGGDNSTNSSNSGQNLTSRGVGVSINGQRESGTEILLDGVENVGVFSAGIGEQTPVDSVQEYSVITNNFAAEYGRASGGVVNVTTKSGTNEVHGSAWEFNRLSAYTANTYANDSAGLPKGIYTRNQFGYAAGGPLKKDKLFLFESTEWTRVRSAAIETQEIFDPAFIAMLPSNTQAYFKAYATHAYNASGAVTTAGQLASAQNGITVGLINGRTAVPLSTPILDTINYTAPFDAGGDVPQNTYRLAGRLDFNMTSNTSMFFRGARETVDQFIGSAFYSPYPQYDVGYNEVNQSYLYSVSHIFNTALLDSLKLSFTRFNDANTFDTAQTQVPNLMFVSPTDPATGQEIVLPGLENYSEPGAGGLPYGGPQNTIQAEDDLTWTRGNHAMRFGGGLTYIQLNVAYGAYAQAVEELGSTGQDSMNDLINSAGNASGSPLISFQARVDPGGEFPCVATPAYWESLNAGSPSAPGDVIGSPNCTITPPLGAPSYSRSYRYKDWAFYAQDSYRAARRLTLNYGVRYEHYGVQHNSNPSLDANFYYGSGANLEEQVRNGQMYIADKSPVGGFWKPRWGSVGPRVGFAWDMLGNGTTSVRGGYGISYERNFGNVTFNASFNPPWSEVINLQCPAEDASCASVVTNNDLGTLGRPGPASYLPPAELRMPDPDIQVAQTQFWSFAVQRQLGGSTVAEGSYSGAKGTHLYDVENINLLGAGQAYLGDPLSFSGYPSCSSPCFNRPNDQFSNINRRGSMGSSAYEALNLRVQSQNLKNSGLTIVANYTWSHSLDDLSSTFGDSLQGGSGYIGSLGYTSLLDPGLDWGSSDFDVRQRLAVTPIWELPWYKSQGPKLAQETVGGWNISGMFTARNGIPFSVFDYDNELNYYTVPRLTPAAPITHYRVSSSRQAAGANLFNALSIPIPANWNTAAGTDTPLNPILGISDFGPFPGSMTRRNSFRGPGGWDADAAITKKFPITERVSLEFRAEGFDFLNHHDYFVNTTTLAYAPVQSGQQLPPLQVTEEKGGLGSLATGGNHDERRFGQFALSLRF